MKKYDIAVVGGGPAGMSAALYGLRNGKSVVIVEKSVFGGQIVNSPFVENIPGFEGISGEEFGDLMMNQVSKQGGELIFDEVTSIEHDEKEVRLHLDLGEDILATTCILAIGTTHRVLGLENEENFIGKNIHFCAVCDGNFYKDKKVVMIGGGNSALVDSNFLSNLVSKLVILQDLDHLTGEKRLIEKLERDPKIEIHTSTKILEYVIEDNQFVGVKYQENNEIKMEKCDGVFLAIGLVPNNKAFENCCDLDERGYFKSDENALSPYPNIFVAGDCRKKSLRQVVTACSDGANAAIKACEYCK